MIRSVVQSGIAHSRPLFVARSTKRGYSCQTDAIAVWLQSEYRPNAKCEMQNAICMRWKRIDRDGQPVTWTQSTQTLPNRCCKIMASATSVTWNSSKHNRRASLLANDLATRG